LRSLRNRLRGWVVATSALTVGLVTAAGLVEERHQIERAEAAYVGSFLEHLAAMPEFRGRSGTARAHLDMLAESFHRVGGSVQLAPLGTGVPPPGGPFVTRQPLLLEEGAFELQYRSDGRYALGRFRRALAIHLAHGLATVLVLVLGIEWILRRNLLTPLDTISRQIERITEGGGWFASVPQADVELTRLTGALRSLGPGLEVQTRRWIETERRCAAAAVLSDLREAVLGPLRDAHLELSQMEASPAAEPSTKSRLRRAARAVEQLSVVLRESEERWFPATVAQHPRTLGPNRGPS
jgi:hypothetical protein